MNEHPETTAVREADAARLDAIHAEVSALLTEAAAIARRAIPDDAVTVFIDVKGVAWSRSSGGEFNTRTRVSAVFPGCEGDGFQDCRAAELSNVQPVFSAALASVAAQVAEARHE